MLLLRLRLTVLTGSPGWPRCVICDFFTRARGGIGDRSRLLVEGGIRWRELRADSQRAAWMGM
jgi:hypothetical protein